jgi:hypothetical protein
VVTTLAGGLDSQIAGYADGVGTNAQFQVPWGLALNAANTVLWVADIGNFVLRSVNLASAAVATLGRFDQSYLLVDGPASSAYFNRPSGLAFDAAGVLYVADSANNVVRAVQGAGGASPVVGTLAGGSGASPQTAGYYDSTGAQALFNQPLVSAPNGLGSVFVGDYSNNRIRVISVASGAVSTLAGSGAAGAADGVGTAATFNTPWGVAVDINGNVFIADTNNNKIRYIVAATGGSTDLGGEAGATVAHLDTWRERAQALLAWRGQVEGDGAHAVLAFGEGTAEVAGVITSLAPKVAQFFAQCALVGAETGAAARLMATPEELAAVAAIPEAEGADALGSRRWVDTVVRFSLKEAVYKALAPTLQRMIGFEEAAAWPAPASAWPPAVRGGSAGVRAPAPAPCSAVARLSCTCAPLSVTA